MPEKKLSKKTTKTLADVGEIASSILHLANDAIIVIDEEQDIVFFNKGAEQIFGYRAAEVLGQPLELILPPAVAKTHRDDVRGFARSKAGTRLKHERRGILGRRKNGEIFPGEASISRISVSGRKIFLAVFRDVSEQVRREEEIRLQLALTRAIAESDDFDSALQESLRMVCEFAGCDYGEVWLPSNGGLRLVLGPAHYCREKDLENFRAASEAHKFEPAQGLPGRVWVSRKPAWIPDVARDENFPRAAHARTAGLCAAVGIPVLAGKNVAAVINLFFKRDRHEDKNLTALVSTVAAQLGAAFQRRQAQEQLRESEGARLAILDSVDEIVYRVAIPEERPFAGMLEYVSERVTDVLGYRAVDFMMGEKNWFDLIHPDDLTALQAQTARIIQSRRPGLREYRMRDINGTYRWLEDRVSPQRDSSGRVAHLFGVTRDVTERKTAEQALAKGEAFSRDILDSLAAHVCVLDAQGAILAVNKGWTEFARQNNGDPATLRGIGVNYLRVCEKAAQDGDESARAALDGIRAVMGGAQELFSMEYACHSADEQRWFVMRARPMSRGNGNIVVSHQTITERKLADLARQQTETMYREVVENASDLIYTMDLRGYFKHVNAAGLQVSGYSLQELQAASYLDLILPEYRRKVQEVYLRQFAGKLPSSYMEFPFYTKAGELRWLGQSASPIFEGQKIVGYHVIGRDITERKLAEHLLQESEARYRSLFENSNDMIQSLAPDGSFQFVNKAWRRTLGYTDEEAARLKIFDVIHPDSLEECRGAFMRVMNGEPVSQIQFKFIAKDERVIEVEGSASPRILDGKVIATQGFFRDITARKQAQEAIAASERRFRALIENSADAITLLDPEGVVIYDSPAAPGLLGYEPDEWIKRNIFEVLHPDDQAQARVIFKSVLEKPLNRASHLLRARHNDGSWRWLELVATNLLDEPAVRAIVVNYGDITERRRAQTASNLMQATALAIAEAPDFNSALDAALRTLCEATGWKYAEAWTPRPDQSVLELGTVWHGSGKKAEKFRSASREFTFHPGEGLPGRVWTKKAPEWIPDVSVNGDLFRRAPQALEAGLKAGMGVPIIGNGDVLVVAFFMFEARPEDRNLMDIAMAVGSQLGTMLLRKRAEEDLRQSEEKFRSLTETLPIGIAVTTPEGGIIEANPALVKLLGYDSKEEFLQTAAFIHYPTPEDRQRFVEELTTHGRVTDFEAQGRRKAGALIWVSVTSVVRETSGGEVTFVHSVQDITERKRAEAERAQLLTVLESSLNEIYIFDAETLRFQYANQGALRNLGYSREAMGEMTPVDLKPEFDLDSFRALIGPLLRLEQEKLIFHTVHRRADGSLYPIEVHLQMSDFEGKRVFHATILDITERKQAEDALRRAEQNYRNIFENSLNGIFQSTPEGRFIMVNPVLARIWGYDSPEDLLASVTDIARQVYVDPNRRATHARLLKEQGGSVVGFEYQAYRKDGSTVWVSENVHSVVDADGALLYYEGALEDISERKRAEAETHLLQVLTKAVTESESFDTALSLALGLVCMNTGWDFGEVWLPSWDGTYLELGSPHHGLEKYRSISEGFKFATGIGLPGRVWESRRPAWIPDVSLEANFPRAEFAAEAGLKAAVGIPILAGDTIVAVMNFFLKEARQEDERTIMLVSTVAAQLGTAFQRRQDEENIRQRLGELEVLYESGLATSQLLQPKVIAQKIIELLDQKLHWHHSTIRLYHPQDETLELLAFNQPGIESEQERNALAERFNASVSKKGQGLSGWAVEHAQSVRTNDLPHDPRYLETFPGLQSGLYVPIKIAERVIGVVSIESEEANAFSEADERLTATLAAQAASALENARLFDETRQRLKRIQALRNIDMAISGSTDLRVTFTVALDEIVNQLGIDAACILRLDPHTQVLTYAAGRGFQTNAIEKTAVRLGEGHAGRAALERESVQVANLSATGAEFARAGLLAGENFNVYYAIPLIAKGHVLGVLEIFNRSALEGGAEWLEFLKTLAGQTAIAIDNTSLFQNLERSNINLLQAYDATIEGWSQAMDMRDKETEGHVQRVTKLTEQLVRAMGMSHEETLHARRGALLHDIGKIGVPDPILLKAEKLTEEEWAFMKKHPVFAYNMLAPIAYLKPALDIPYCHHEKWDGTGYPRGLIGEQIPLAARLFAFADVYDALTSDRPYREKWSKEKTLDYIREQSGKQFDPHLVEIFMRVVDDFEEK